MEIKHDDYDDGDDDDDEGDDDDDHDDCKCDHRRVGANMFKQGATTFHGRLMLVVSPHFPLQHGYSMAAPDAKAAEEPGCWWGHRSSRATL